MCLLVAALVVADLGTQEGEMHRDLLLNMMRNMVSWLLMHALGIW